MTLADFLLLLMVAALPIIVIFVFLKYISRTQSKNYTQLVHQSNHMLVLPLHYAKLCLKKLSTLVSIGMTSTGFYKSPIHMFLLRPSVNRVVSIICILIFLSSLYLPGVMTFRTGGHGYEEISSLMILAIGWMAPLSLTPQFAWYASPLFILAACQSLMGYYELASQSSKASLLLASNTFLWFVWPTAGDEGGVTHTYLKYPLSGFTVWYLSIVILAIFNSSVLRPSTKQSNTETI